MALTEEVTPDINPGDDFYRFVNQKWLEANPLPADKARIGSFSVLADENTDRLRALLEQPGAADNEPASLIKLRQFYRAAMDEAAIERAGLEPVRPVLEEIAGLKSHEDIARFMAGWQERGLSLVWHAFREVDDKNSRRYLLQLYQGGLAMPEREYYLEDAEQFKTARTKYREFLEELFKLLNLPHGSDRASAVLDLETELAKVSVPAADRRDPDKMYNLFKVTELNERFPDWDWPGYLEKIGAGQAAELVIAQPDFINGALDILASQPAEAWQDYLRVHCLLPVMSKLPKAYDELHFSFFGQALSGAQEQEPRYRRVINLCLNLLSEPTGRLFVSAHFDESAKQAIYQLVGHLTEAFRSRLEQLEWMSAETKQKALEKLGTFLPLLGYPDEWRDYGGLELPGTYAANFLAAQQFEWRRDMQRLTQPVDRKEWLMSPAMVNAYYWSNTNGITFPAGILQPPFFDATGDFAANYGGIGVVIGHELTHGFDDQGSKFDKTGNLQSWWTEEDRQKFEEVAGRLADLFDSFEINGRKVNGRLTLGENIADLGGVMIAFDALQRYLEETGRREEIDGCTPEQRFFMNYARIWRQNIRPELALQFLVSDPHSPTQFRVNGIVPNVNSFYAAFDVREGQQLFRPEVGRVRIW